MKQTRLNELLPDPKQSYAGNLLRFLLNLIQAQDLDVSPTQLDQLAGEPSLKQESTFRGDG